MKNIPFITKAEAIAVARKTSLQESLKRKWKKFNNNNGKQRIALWTLIITLCIAFSIDREGVPLSQVIFYRVAILFFILHQFISLEFLKNRGKMHPMSLYITYFLIVFNTSDIFYQIVFVK